MAAKKDKATLRRLNNGSTVLETDEYKVTLSADGKHAFLEGRKKYNDSVGNDVCPIHTAALINSALNEKHLSPLHPIEVQVPLYSIERLPNATSEKEAVTVRPGTAGDTWIETNEYRLRVSKDGKTAYFEGITRSNDSVGEYVDPAMAKALLDYALKGKDLTDDAMRKYEASKTSGLKTEIPRDELMQLTPLRNKEANNSSKGAEGGRYT